MKKNIIFLSPIYLTNFIENLNPYDFPIFIISENSKLYKQKIYLLKNYFFKWLL